MNLFDPPCDPPFDSPFSARRQWLVQAAGLGGVALFGLSTPARAHHGWSSFDQERPLYLEGKAAEVKWRNPHAELVLERSGSALPADLSSRRMPAQVAAVDGASVLARTRLPTRSDARWQVELAPLTRMGQWKVPEIRPGDILAVIGFTFAGEQGQPILRAEYLFLGDAVYGLRSGPA